MFRKAQHVLEEEDAHSVLEKKSAYSRARNKAMLDMAIKKHNERIRSKHGESAVDEHDKRRTDLMIKKFQVAAETALLRKHEIEVVEEESKIELPNLTSFLYEQYQPQYWWYESFELLYKLSVTGLVVFFEACGISTPG